MRASLVLEQTEDSAEPQNPVAYWRLLRRVDVANIEGNSIPAPT